VKKNLIRANALAYFDAAFKFYNMDTGQGLPAEFSRSNFSREREGPSAAGEDRTWARMSRFPGRRRRRSWGSRPSARSTSNRTTCRRRGNWNRRTENLARDNFALPVDRLPVGGLPVDGLPVGGLPVVRLPVDRLPVDLSSRGCKSLHRSFFCQS
jgi:hypothetical protein